MPIIIVIFDTPPHPLSVKYTPSPILILLLYTHPLFSTYLFGGGVLSWNVYLKIDMFHVERFVKKYNVPRHFNWCWYGVSLFIDPIPLEKKEG